MLTYFDTPKDYRKNYLNILASFLAKIATISAIVFGMMYAFIYFG